MSERNKLVGRVDVITYRPSQRWHMLQFQRISAKIDSLEEKDGRGCWISQQTLRIAIICPEAGRISIVLGLDDLVIAEVDAVGQGIQLVVGCLDGRLGLVEERDNGLASVAANDGNEGLRWVFGADDALSEGLAMDDVEGGDAEELLTACLW